MIEMGQLQTLVAVAELKSFSKAAEKLRVTQSAISQSIKNLEKKTNFKLFKRSGKTVILTPEGKKLYSTVHPFLSRLDDTLEEIQDDKKSMSGLVRIGTLAGVGKSWLAHELLLYASENKDLEISIQLGFQEDLVKDFENYQLDFLILPDTHLPSIGKKKFIGEEYLVFVFPDNPEFEIRKGMNLETLSSYPTILFQDENDGLYLRWCQELYGKIPQKINKRYVINSHGNMLQAVQRGLGVAVIPQHVLNGSYYKDKVKCLEEAEVSNGKFYIIYHSERENITRLEKTLKRLTSVQNPFDKIL